MHRKNVYIDMVLVLQIKYKGASSNSIFTDDSKSELGLDHYLILPS